MSHSETAGTEHHGNVITSMHGLPITYTPVQDSMNLEPACPDWHDHREHIDGTMAHSPSPVHRVYAHGKTVATLPAPGYGSAAGKQSIQDANQIAAQYRQRARILGLDPVEVTVDAWVPGRVIATWTDTMPDDGLTVSVYQEALDAHLAYEAEWEPASA